MGTGTIVVLSVLAVIGIVSVAALRKRKTETVRGAASKSPATPPAQKPAKPINQVAARQTFLKNVDKFSSLLPSLLDGGFKGQQKQSLWDDEIIDLQDQDLLALCKLVRNDEKTVKHILSQWGLTSDNCSSFQCMEFHKDMYETSEGKPLEIGEKYEVVAPCWILTIHGDDDKIVKKIVRKGVVK